MKCDNCNNNFEPSIPDSQRIKQAIQSGTKFLVLNCSLCHNHTSWKSELYKDEDLIDYRFLRCPIGQCTGWVETNPVKDIFECQTCGSIWNQRENLNTAVQKIIAEYPYRKEVYQKVMQDYISDLNIVVEGYSAKVYQEIDGIKDSFMRDMVDDESLLQISFFSKCTEKDAHTIWEIISTTLSQYGSLVSFSFEQYWKLSYYFRFQCQLKCNDIEVTFQKLISDQIPHENRVLSPIDLVWNKWESQNCVFHPSVEWINISK